MTGPDFEHDPMERDDDLLNAIAQGTAGAGDGAGDLLGQLTHATDIDYTDERAIQAIIAQAGLVGAATAQPSNSFKALGARHRRFIVLAVLVVAALAAVLVLAFSSGFGPDAVPAPSSYQSGPDTSTGSASASGASATQSRPPSTLPTPAQAEGEPVAQAGAPAPAVTSSSVTASAPLLRRLPMPTASNTSRRVSMLGPLANPSTASTTVAAATNSATAFPTRTGQPTTSPTSSPATSPTTPTPPSSTSPPTCQVTSATLSGSAAAFTRLSTTQATLTWQDPFGTGKEVVLTYTAHSVGTATQVSTADNFRFTPATIGGQASGGLTLALQTTSGGAGNTAPTGMDVDLAFTYGGKAIDARDAAFVVADIDGPYSGSGDPRTGAEQVALAGPGSGTAVNPRYLTGTGSSADPWRRANPSVPDTAELDSSVTDGVVSIYQPRVSSSTISYRIAGSRSREGYDIWLTPPDFTVIEPGC